MPTQEWQKKLSALRVTHLPWDPAPPPPAQPVPSTASDRKPPPQPAPLPSNGNAMSTPPLPNAPQRIKQEPGYPNQPLPSNNYALPLPTGSQHDGGQNIAQQRAALHLQQRYGAQANQQVQRLQQGGASRLPPQPMPQQIPMKRENQELQIKREAQEPMFKQEDQKPPMGMQSQPNLPQQYKAPINPSQLDGSGDDMQAYRADIARRREAIASQRSGADRLFRQHQQETQQRLEGGGLMLPLEERYMPTAAVRRQVHALEIGEGSGSSTGGTWRDIGSARSSLARAQGDATGDDDDDDEVDEDAINSDLDDPDEPGEENNEEETDQVMLCTYDKVARVKNKWKCTLKDGILRVDGSE
jgi:transcription initiation factor TFIIA large subunit